MKVYDLTHAISADTPVYPGMASPRLSPVATVERDGYHETEIVFYSHTGTHVDPPAHIFSDGITLDRLSPEVFMGSAFVLDCAQLGEGGCISPEMLREREAEIRSAEFLLLHTGWENYWGGDAYFGAFPVLTAEAATWLSMLPQLKGVGVDAISLDPMGCPLDNHRILLASGKLLIENLKGLGELAGKRLQFAALPLHYVNSDGAPVRAIAWDMEAP